MKLINGNSLNVLKTFEENSVDAIVTDPPYGLSFMGKKWDYDVPSVEIWQECLRVLKPGGYLLAFAGTRTQHRMAVRIEDAGFEIRDLIMYVYGSGFPKSTNIYKQLTKRCTCGNMVAYDKNRNDRQIHSSQNTEHQVRPMQNTNISETINPQNKQGEVLQSKMSEQGTSIESVQFSDKVWEGQSSLEGRSNAKENTWKLSGNDLSEMSKGIPSDGEERRIYNATQASDGTAPKQIIDENGSSASQRPQSTEQQDREPCAFCQQYGTQAMGAFGIGSALKPAVEPITVARKPISEKNLAANFLKWGVGGINIDECRVGTEEIEKGRGNRTAPQFSGKYNNGETYEGHNAENGTTQGRFPANLIHDGSDEVVELFPNTKAATSRTTNKTKGVTNFGAGDAGTVFNDGGGSASRFFYCAKASKSERNKGCEELEEKDGGCLEGNSDMENNRKIGANPERKVSQTKNNHPTVKPIALMEYLIKLVIREGAIVLDPFMGSGSTGIAAKNLNRDFIGIELSEEYLKIAEARINNLPDTLI